MPPFKKKPNGGSAPKGPPAIPVGTGQPPTSAESQQKQAVAVRPLQSLNALEEALRREYGLVGEIRALYEAVLRPVIIAGDLKDPGHAVNKSRAFVWAGNALSAAAGITVLSLRFDEEVLIEGLSVTMSTSQHVSLYLTTPGETIPIAVTGQKGTWRDRKSGPNDLPPIQGATAFGALTGTAQSDTNVVASMTNQSPYVAIKIHLPAGSALTWRSETTQTRLGLALWGRIFP